MKWLPHTGSWTICNRYIIPWSFSISEFKMVKKEIHVFLQPVLQWLLRATVWTWMSLKGLYVKGLVPNVLVLVAGAARNYWFIQFLMLLMDWSIDEFIISWAFRRWWKHGSCDLNEWNIEFLKGLYLVPMSFPHPTFCISQGLTHFTMSFLMNFCFAMSCKMMQPSENELKS